MAVRKEKRMSKRQFDRIARALAEPRRVEILKEVGTWKKPQACNTLLEMQHISAPTLSHHIKELETAGLLQVIKDGKFSNLCLNREMLREYAELLAQL
jgi:ArsR family transcriptional regulator, arsenate/arsenite/antimonite-responsive transcriptional repressor